MPKIAAIDAIARLEPVGRGASMGSLGRICPNWHMDLALTIRAFAVADDAIHLRVGGGAVRDSQLTVAIGESWPNARPLLVLLGSGDPQAANR